MADIPLVLFGAGTFYPHLFYASILMECIGTDKGAPLRMEVRLAIPLLDRLEPHHEVLPIRLVIVSMCNAFQHVDTETNAIGGQLLNRGHLQCFPIQNPDLRR